MHVFRQIQIQIHADMLHICLQRKIAATKKTQIQIQIQNTELSTQAPTLWRVNCPLSLCPLQNCCDRKLQNTAFLPTLDRSHSLTEIDFAQFWQ